MSRQPFAARVETFGLDTADPWALEALRLLFNTPRAYAPLVLAWEQAHPGVRRALDRLVASGLVSYQPGLIVDTRTGLAAVESSRRVPRYRTTSKGTRLVAAVAEDPLVLQDVFPRTVTGNVDGVRALLSAFDLQDSHAKFGLSAQHATALSGLPNPNVKWWIRTLRAKGYLKELTDKHADVREVIPEHWRVSRALCRQLLDVLTAFPAAPQTLRVEFRLTRSRFLSDIDPARVGISGATDFDHDVECQRVLAALLSSPSAIPSGIFVVEPKFTVPADMSAHPWEFVAPGNGQVFYQPDAQMRERTDGKVVRSVLEYERFQSRRDAWNHIERFLGYLATSTLPFEPAILRFVVDSRPRERAYVELIEAFCDYALDHPGLLPANPVTLAVSSVTRVASAADPLGDDVWFRIAVPVRSDTAGRPVLHPADDSPYDEYFARG
jgi:hypothetical protein